MLTVSILVSSCSLEHKTNVAIADFRQACRNGNREEMVNICDDIDRQIVPRASVDELDRIRRSFIEPLLDAFDHPEKYNAISYFTLEERNYGSSHLGSAADVFLRTIEHLGLDNLSEKQRTAYYSASIENLKPNDERVLKAIEALQSANANEGRVIDLLIQYLGKNLEISRAKTACMELLVRNGEISLLHLGAALESGRFRDDDTFVELVVRICTNNPDAISRFFAKYGRKMRDERLLHKVLEKKWELFLTPYVAWAEAGGEDVSTMIVTLKKIKDKNSVAFMIANRDQNLRMAAVSNISDQEQLFRIAVEDDALGVALSAIEKIKSPEDLWRIACARGKPWKDYDTQQALVQRTLRRFVYRVPHRTDKPDISPPVKFTGVRDPINALADSLAFACVKETLGETSTIRHSEMTVKESYRLINPAPGTSESDRNRIARGVSVTISFQLNKNGVVRDFTKTWEPYFDQITEAEGAYSVKTGGNGFGGAEEVLKMLLERR